MSRVSLTGAGITLILDKGSNVFRIQAQDHFRTWALVSRDQDQQKWVPRFDSPIVTADESGYELANGLGIYWLFPSLESTEILMELLLSWKEEDLTLRLTAFQKSIDISLHLAAVGGKSWMYNIDVLGPRSLSGNLDKNVKSPIIWALVRSLEGQGYLVDTIAHVGVSRHYYYIILFNGTQYIRVYFNPN